MTAESPNKPCILIVEDDAVIRQPLAQYLRECGYRVLEAINTGEARTLLGERSEMVDICLCDVDHPAGMDGFSLAQWIRRHAPHVRILLSGTPARAAEKAGDLCEDGPLLAKPYDHRLLLDRIRSLIAQRERDRK